LHPTRCLSDSNQVMGNVTAVVPFLGVSDMDESVRYYVAGLGFTMTNQWIDNGRLRWCWLEKGGAAIMLQEFWRDGSHTGRPEGKLGQGVSLAFQCRDALAIYREITKRGVEASELFVGNALWTFFLSDPDGYRIDFASPTDTPEDTKLSELAG
jgi:lactoylglutathione lyase